MAKRGPIASLAIVACALLVAPQLTVAAGEKPPVNVTKARAIERLEARVRALAKKTKTQDQIDSENARAVKQERNAVCAFSIMQAVNFLARSAFQIHTMVKFCPEAVPGELGYKPAWKSCLISTASLITSMSQIAAGIALSVHVCQDTLKIDALCAAPIAALLTPTTQFIAASTVASAACAKEADQLPKEIELDRRLQEAPPAWAMEPDARKWQIGECVIDATSAVMAMGQLATGFNAATRSCPLTRGEPLQEEVSRAVCTIDTGFTFFSFSRLVLFIALAVEHCAPGNQADSLCVAACVGLTAAGFAVTFQGAAIYVNCQIGEEKGAIIAGTSPVLGRRLDERYDEYEVLDQGRPLSRGELLDELSKASGFSRRLTKSEYIYELAKESPFDTPEELWLSLGYNFSDPDAEWKKEDPGIQRVINEGKEMLEKLQTTREEPAAELLKYGPEEVPPSAMPEILVDQEDEDATLTCSQKGYAYSLDLPGHATSLEQGVAACQARCARTVGCVRFSFWPPDKHCRLHGILAEPIPGQPLWVSGPAGCQEAQISEATLRIMKRKEHCYHPHAVYEPRDTLAEPRPAASIEDCQRRCQQMRACAHWVFSELDGLCSLAEASAVKLQPVLHNVAGPRHCPDAAMSFTGMEKGVGAKFEETASPFTSIGSSTMATIAALAACAVAGAVLALSAALVISRRVYRGVAGSEAATLE